MDKKLLQGTNSEHLSEVLKGLVARPLVVTCRLSPLSSFKHHEQQFPWMYGVLCAIKKVSCASGCSLYKLTMSPSEDNQVTHLFRGDRNQSKSSFPESRNDGVFIHMFIFSQWATISCYDGKGIRALSWWEDTTFIKEVFLHLWETKPPPS